MGIPCYGKRWTIKIGLLRIRMCHIRLADGGEVEYEVKRYYVED